MALLSFILAVFPIVIIHEFGHFLVGKALGAQPSEFSVGFGRSILNFKWLGANFKIGWIPLGGYVKFDKIQFDIEFGEGKKEGDKLEPWRWVLISFAGPVSNFILTGLIFFGFIFAATGSMNTGVVGQDFNELKQGSTVLVVENSPLANLVRKTLLEGKKGDVFVKTPEGIQETQYKYDEVQFMPIELKKTYGVVERAYKSMMVSGAMIAFSFTATTKALANLFSAEGYKGMMGPVGIASQANEARNEGILQFLLLVASLSFAVGYFNLLPLSFLDGGRALLGTIEQITKYKISEKMLVRLNVFGFSVIISLMGMAFFSDFMRLMDK